MIKTNPQISQNEIATGKFYEFASQKRKKMYGNRQTSAVFVVCQKEKLLKQLGIKNRHQKIKTGVVVGYQRKNRGFLLTKH